MGNHHSSNLNEIQDLLNNIRSKAGHHNIDVDASVAQIKQAVENPTVTNANPEAAAEEQKLQFVAEIIQSDDVVNFVDTMDDDSMDVTDRMGSLQLTPLHLAAYYNSFQIIKHLLKLPHVEVNSPNTESDTPLNYGLLGAKDDAKAIQLIRTFLTRKDLDTLSSNGKLMFPLLICIQRKFPGASKLLLTCPHKQIVDEYEPWGLVKMVKLALTTNQDSLIDVVHHHLSNSRRLQLLEEMRSQSNSDIVEDLITLLEKSLLNGTDEEIISGNVNINSNDSQQDYSHLDKTGTLGSAYGTTKVAAPEPDILTTTEDAGGTELKVGNIVKTLSIYTVKKGLPPGARESDILRLSEKTATIHEITGNKIYVEIHGEQLVARMKAEVTIFQNEGVSTLIGDGSSAKIGSYVQVLADEDEVRKLTGTAAGWIHGMADACGRTGRIVRFLPNYDVLVQFAWGPRFYFKPDALLQSSSDRIETQDYKNNWIEVGSLVQVKKTKFDFVAIQKKNMLPYDGSHTELPWKFAVVKAIRVKAFSASKTIKICYKGAMYFVHVECIERIDSVKHKDKTDLKVGYQVQVLQDVDQVKMMQEDQPGFGGWAKGMTEVVGEVGKVARVCIDENSESNSVMVKIVFPEFVSFFFNPNAVEIFTGTVVTKLKPIFTKTERKPVVEEEDKWEQIDRSSLKCFETLGEGGFGCVVRGEWLKNGVTKAVAIKQVKAGVTSGAGPLDEVLKEAKIQFSMRHPNIVSLFGISLEKNLWIVMDLVDGNDLFNLLFPVGKDPVEFSMKQKLKFAVDMSNAIAYIHQKRYLHCDIKPHNMMVDSRSEKLYVCDFGITKFLGNMDMMSFATQYTNSVSGTLYYISPECLQPDAITGKYRKPTFAADIWALGAVFYELFVVEHLYEHHMKFLQDKLVNRDADVKRRLNELPKEVLPIVSKALNFNYNGRPTAQELCEFFHELH